MAAAVYLAAPEPEAGRLQPAGPPHRRADRGVPRRSGASSATCRPSVRDRLKVIDDHLGTLNGTRQEVLDRQQMPVAEASLRYGIILTDLVSYGDTLAQQPGGESLADARRAVAAFAHAKAAVAEEQAVAFTALASGRLDEEQFSSFVATLTSQQEALLAFSRAAEPGAAEPWSTARSPVTRCSSPTGSRPTCPGRSVSAPLVTRDDASAAIGAVDDLMRWAEIQLQDRLSPTPTRRAADGHPAGRRRDRCSCCSP